METKILVVDDHPAIRSTMLDVLESEGFCTFVASNGIEANNLYVEHEFDFVLMDMQMPDIKGVNLFRKMQVLRKKSAEFIFISAFSAPELENEARELGCIAFLHKPIQVEEVIKIIRSRKRTSILLFIENNHLRDNVGSEIRRGKFGIEECDNIDDALILLRQINYNFVVLDQDSPGLEQERVSNTIKVANSQSRILEINEDQEPTIILKMIAKHLTL